MDIDKYVVSLERLMKNINNCYGHIKDEQHETIVEHIQLCIKYLKEIFELKRLDKIMIYLMKEKKCLMNFLLIRSFSMIAVK